MNELAARLRAVPEGDLSIGVAAVSLGIASVVAFSRLQDPWADFPLFLVLAIPCAVLLSLGLAFARDGDRIGAQPDGRLAPWQTVCLLIGIPLLVVSFIQLLVVFGKDSPGTGTVTWLLVLGGAAALALTTRAESPGLVLLAGLFFGVAGLTAVDWIDSDAPVATYRDVLLIEGALYLFAARQVWVRLRAEANLLIGLAGSALIAGAVLGKTGEPDSPFGLFFGLGVTESGGDGWELVLVIVVIGLLAYSAWQRHGGLAVIGAAGFLAFVSFAGVEGNLWGWPILLVLVAAGCLYWSLELRQRQSGGSVPPTSQAPPASPGGPPPPST